VLPLITLVLLTNFEKIKNQIFFLHRLYILRQLYVYLYSYRMFRNPEIYFGHRSVTLQRSWYFTTWIFKPLPNVVTEGTFFAGCQRLYILLYPYVSLYILMYSYRSLYILIHPYISFYILIYPYPTYLRIRPSLRARQCAITWHGTLTHACIEASKWLAIFVLNLHITPLRRMENWRYSSMYFNLDAGCVSKEPVWNPHPQII
jgi:hypothetical protein